MPHAARVRSEAVSRLSLLACLLAVGHAASAIAQTIPYDDRPARHVVHSASGGISKGSYQGGVDWTVSEFLRRQHNDDFRAVLNDKVIGVPEALKSRFELGSVTGASAGNINALFAALAWCTRSTTASTSNDYAPIQAEASLFWSAWTTTGVGELLPLSQRHLPEAAAFTRQYFETRHKPDIWRFMTSARAVTNCHLPVGVTMTKLTPIEVAIVNDQGSAKVQRFSSVFLVQGVRGLDFAYPSRDGIPDKESLGAMALLPDLKSADPDLRQRRLDRVFDVVLASSAFPVAFASKRICYEPGGLKPRNDGTAAPCARFIDGGVFDNNPLGLAVRLFEITSASDQQALDLEVAYTSPDQFRGPLADARRPATVTPDRQGLAGLLQLGSGAIDSARQYELQTLARQLARDVEALRASAAPESVQARPRLLQSSRGTPIVGETLGAFGAFLGQPFREYDFYAGIYDGLEFVARRFVCPELGQADDPDCAVRIHVRLLETDAFGLSPVGRTVLHWLREHEYQPSAPPAVTLTPDEAARVVVLKGVHDAFSRYRKDAFPESRCRGLGDPIERILCPGGLDEALRRLADDAAVATAAAALRSACDLGRPCHVDQTFLALLARPRRHVYLLAKKAVENVEHGEEAVARDEPGAPTYEGLVEAAFSFFRASTFRYRNGIAGKSVELNLSTGRWDWEHLAPSIANLALPNYLIWTPGHRPTVPVVVGWRPVTLTFGTRVFMSTSLEWAPTRTRNERIEPGTEPGRVGLGASVGSFAWRPLKATTIEAGVYHMPEVMTRTLGWQDQWAGRVSARWFSDKLTLGVVGRKRGEWAVQLGLSDLNGIVYWWLR